MWLLMNIIRIIGTLAVFVPKLADLSLKFEPPGWMPGPPNVTQYWALILAVLVVSQLRENRTRGDAREEPKGPGPSPGSAPGSLRAPHRPRHPGGRPGQSPHQPGCPAPSAATHHLQLAAP